jgi:predicted nucleic acid-binding protein
VPIVVVDANLAVWHVLPVLAPAGVKAHLMFALWVYEGTRVVAPSLWLAEYTSAVRIAVYTRVISTEKGREAIEMIPGLGIETLDMDAKMCQAAFGWAARLGQSKAYDGFYLALAERLGAEFWTADRKLANGARQAKADWVRWVGEE